ncbi:uncharacterized protein LOC127723806 [Mytilus californianus]|uniref:uncharacterized protein LOC127723806 n=1 Tax=Mytilus californianus TaxID=6549 RepID=UPI0022471621|nr:uncharacterized protein LOC127723806 [Mytilus californianus]
MADQFECEPCMKRKRQSKASNWCLQCEEFMCAECTASHRSMRKLQHCKIIEAKDIPLVTNMSLQSCNKHGGLLLKLFCVDHDVMCCPECVNENHKGGFCRNVMHIDEASTGIKTSHIFVESNKQIDHIIKSLNGLRNELSSNIENIELNTKKIKEEIANTKEALIRHIESLEKVMLEELIQKTQAYLKQTKRRIKETEEILRLTKEHADAFDFVQKNRSERQAFLLIHNSKESLTRIEDRVAKLDGNSLQLQISFVGSSLEDAATEIGKLDLIETKRTNPFASSVLRHSQSFVGRKSSDFSFVFLKELDLKLLSASPNYTITGMAISGENELMLCDIKKSRIILFDTADIYRSYIKLSDKPWDIASLGQSSAVVSSRDVDSIQFIDLKKMSLIKNVKVRDSSKGAIATTDESILVGADGKIHVLDHDGSGMKIITVPAEGTVSYICTPSVNSICFCDGSDETKCVTFDGDLVFSYQSPELVKTKNVTADNDGHIYIVGEDSHNIHHLSRDGKFIDIVLSDDNQLYYPIAITFSKDYSKFYVACKFYDIRVFNVKKR